MSRTQSSFHPANWPLRLAREEDVPAITELIPLSVRALQSPYYSQAQMEAAIGPVQPIYGRLIDQTHSYDLGLGLVGFFPLIGAAAMLLLWPNHDANDADKKTA